MNQKWKRLLVIPLAVSIMLSNIAPGLSLEADAEESVPAVYEGQEKDSGFEPNIDSGEGSIDAREIVAQEDTKPVITQLIPGYSSVKIIFTPMEGITAYDVLRSEIKSGPFIKVGTAAGNAFTDETETGKFYFYKVASQDGVKESDPMGTAMPTGIEALKKNAVVFEDLSGQTFDGSTLVDVSDKAADVGKLSTGSILIKFKTTERNSFSLLLMGKTHGGNTPLNTSGNKAAFSLSQSGNSMLLRADMAHTRASVPGTDYADGEWHTIMITQTDSDYVFRFAGDGRDLLKFQGDTNKGFFSTVNNLDEVTIGGFYNNSETVVSNGFKGEIAYVAVTDEVNTIEEAKAITASESGIIISELTEKMFDQSVDNTWVFAGGADVAGGYEQSRGFRNYMGQFEEYIRYTKYGDGRNTGIQRYMINTGKAGNTLQDVDRQFESLVTKYDPRALSVLIGEEDFSAGEEGLQAFKETLHSLVEKALALRSHNGFLVIQAPYARKDETQNTLAQLYKDAALEVVNGLPDETRRKVVLVNHFKMTNNDTFKTNKLNSQGHLNPLGHLEIAKELAKETYGTNDGFPFNDSNYKLVKTETPEVYLEEMPTVDAEDTQLTLSIPDSVWNSAGAWKYSLEISDQTISGALTQNPIVIDGLTEDSPYTATVTSDDGKIQLAAVTGIVKRGNKCIKKPVTQSALTDLQKEVNKIAESDKPATWLFIGDSITHGCYHLGGYDSIHQTFEKFLREDLGRKDDVVINTAVSSSTTREQEENSNERLDKYDIDVGIVMLGTNDSSNNMVPLDEFRKNLTSIVEKIQNKGAVAVLRTPQPVRPADIGNRINLPEYVEVIREVAEEKGALLADHYAEWLKEIETRAYLWQNGYWDNNFLHPNANGQLNMAQSLIRNCGLAVETGLIYNLAYEMPHTNEQSNKAIRAKAEENTITVDMKALENSYGSTFGSARITAVSNGKTFSSTAVKGDSTLILRNLPGNMTYQVTVTAELIQSSKTVLFGAETVKVEGIETYTVRFLDKDGNILNTQNVEKGKNAAAPEAPEAEGYRFIGWDKDYTNVQSELEVRAVYEKTGIPVQTYTVTFLDKDGKQLELQTVEKGKSAAAPKLPDVAGYTFLKWDQDFQNVQSDLVVKALYAKNAVKVEKIYLSKSNLLLAVGQTEILSVNAAPENASNQKVQWSSSNTNSAVVDSSGRVTAKAPGSAVIKAAAQDGSGNTAVCEVNVGYKLTYQLNKGKNVSANPSIYRTDQKTVLKAPSRSKYTFEGWYTDKKYEHKIKALTKGTKGNITLYAKWKKVTVDRVKPIHLSNPKKGQLQIKFSRVGKAKGYQIQYSTSSNFKKNHKNLLLKKNSYTVKKLKKERTYYVRVRAYKTDSERNKVYGKFRTVKLRLEK